jgi:hypothetical protein
MPQYMLLLHENPAAFADVTPNQMQAIIDKYKAWATKLAQAGRLAGSNKLHDTTGRSMKTVNGKIVVTDGPYTEASEVIGGYFMISAESYDEAVKLSEGCPHIEYGVVEIREIEPTGN